MEHEPRKRTSQHVEASLCYDKVAMVRCRSFSLVWRSLVGLNLILLCSSSSFQQSSAGVIAFVQESTITPRNVLLSTVSPHRQSQRTNQLCSRHLHPFHNVLKINRGGDTQLHSTSAAFAAVDAFWKAQHPLVTAAVVCATKAFAADLVAQKRQQGLNAESSTDQDKKFDWRRSFSFVAYGALYQGMAQELIYNNFYSFLFGTATTMRVAIKKVLFDAFFHNALVCIPMAYAVKALIFKYSVVKGIRQYIDDVRYHGLLLKYYAIWMPVNAMLFTLIPPHWRITVMATVSFFWMIILSTISSRARDD